MEFVAHFTKAYQVTEDHWELGHYNLKITGATTLKEIMDWVHTINLNETSVNIHQLYELPQPLQKIQ